MKSSIMALVPLSALLLAACLSGEGQNALGPNGEPGQPGTIRLVHMDGLSKRTATAATGHVFTLDTAKSSFSTYFILQNTGDEDVTDVSLTTNNPGFTFSPSHISVISPTASASLIQIIKLDVVHGPLLNGIGPGTFLSMGDIEVDASIGGQTVDSTGDTLSVDENATFMVFAQLAKIGVTYKGSPIDLHATQRGIMFNDISREGMPVYFIRDSTDNMLTVHNTGNVTLGLRYWNRASSGPPPLVEDREFPPGDSVSFDYPAVFELDPGGVVADPVIFPLQTNGRFMLGL